MCTRVMAQPLVVIAGGGIGGMAPALTLHQIGVPCMVFEAVPELQPLGVGINLQPNAVRELYDLGFDARSSNHRHPGARVGAGRPQRQRHLRRAARPARGLPLAAVLGAPRPAADAAVPGGRSSGSAPPRSGSAIGSPATARRRRRRHRSDRVRATARRARSTARCWSAPMACIRPCARRCTPTSRRSSGAARSCGAARRRACRSAPAHRSSAWAR